MKKLWFLKNIIFVKPDYVFFNRKKNIVWLFFKEKEQNLNFPILYKKTILGFFLIPITRICFFLSTEVNRIWFFQISTCRILPRILKIKGGGPGRASCLSSCALWHLTQVAGIHYDLFLGCCGLLLNGRETI